MQYSQEFFAQRSFEVVWAVFRVGEFVARKELREILERKALHYLSEKTVDNLDELDEAIRLAVQIGEIKDINGKVLLREIGNLRNALREREQSAAAQKDLSERSIEDIFKPLSLPSVPYIQPEQMFSKPESGNNPASVLGDAPESGNDRIESGNVQKPSGDESNTNNKTSSGGYADIQNVPHSRPVSESGKSPTSPLGPINPANSYERKQVILNLLKARTMCGMRDIMAALPHTSERTLRYDIQGLVNRNLVERVGNGGPQSFLRLRGSSSASEVHNPR